MASQLPNLTAGENGVAKIIAFLPQRDKRAQKALTQLPKVVLDVALAERFQGLLDAGDSRNRADLAKSFRFTLRG